MPWSLLAKLMFLNLKRKSLERTLIAAFSLVAASVISNAQSPTYRPPPPPTKGVALEVRLRYLLPPDINFAGFGSIPLNENFRTENDLILGTTRGIEYDDGYLRQDYIQSTLAGGNGDGQQAVESPNSNATSNFGYINEDQVDPNDPSALLFHRYASMSDPNEEFSADSGNALGWELNYTKYINRRRNLGIQVGFSFNGFDSRFNDSISADLYVQEFRHQMEGDVAVPDLPDPIEDNDGNVTQPPYNGDVVREEVSGDLLEWAETAQTEELIADGATVDTKADLRSSLYNFRAGPTYSLSVGQGFGLQMGAGVSAIYFSGRFSAYEMLNNPAGGENPSRSLVTTEDAEWQVGGYVDASAYYQFTDRVSLFSGMQVQSGTTYSQQNEDRYANVDFSAQIYLHAGVGIRF